MRGVMIASTELIIFDCDGVLIDSEGLAHQAWIEALAEYGIHITLEDALRRYAGVSTEDAAADIVLRYKIELPSDYLGKKRARLEQLFEDALQATPGIVGLLDSLEQNKCGASGSSPERLLHSLGLVNLWDRFAPHIFSATQVKNGKPAPDLFLFAAEQMGVHPSACLVIEDSVAGVRAAKAANMRVYGFTGGSHCDNAHGDLLRKEGADVVFGHMSEIAEALRGC